MQDSRNDPEPIKARRDVSEVHCIELHGLGSDAITDTGDDQLNYRKYHHTTAARPRPMRICADKLTMAVTLGQLVDPNSTKEEQRQALRMIGFDDAKMEALEREIVRNSVIKFFITREEDNGNCNNGEAS